MTTKIYAIHEIIKKDMDGLSDGFECAGFYFRRDEGAYNIRDINNSNIYNEKHELYDEYIRIARWDLILFFMNNICEEMGFSKDSKFIYRNGEKVEKINKLGADFIVNIEELPENDN